MVEALSSRFGVLAVGSPARGYSWPSFTAGNQAAEKHGAYSDRAVTPIADRLAAELLDQVTWVRRDAFAPAVAAWSRAEAMVQQVVAWLDERGLLDEDGEPRSATNLLLRLEATAANRRSELGLTPQSFARLLQATADQPGAAEERERLLAEARRLVEAQEAR